MSAGRTELVKLGGVDHQGPLGLVELHYRAEGLGQFHGPPDVLDDRDVAQDRSALLGEQGRRDHLERGVLGALNEDCPCSGWPPRMR